MVVLVFYIYILAEGQFCVFETSKKREGHPAAQQTVIYIEITE